MAEWCEEIGDWIELKAYPSWPDCEVCPWFDSTKVISKKERIYWACSNSGPYDITYGEYYFCPYFHKDVNIWHRCPIYQKKESN